MTAQVTTRETCQAWLRLGGLESPPIVCGQSVGLGHLVAPDGTRLAYCPREGHRGRVERMAKRVHGVVAGYHAGCGGYLDERGECSNAGCPQWRGPFA